VTDAPNHRARAFADAAGVTVKALLARLTAHREALAEGRERLRRAERAVAIVEDSLRHDAAGGRGLSRLVNVLEVHRDLDEMKRYFTSHASTHVA